MHYTGSKVVKELMPQQCQKVDIIIYTYYFTDYSMKLNPIIIFSGYLLMPYPLETKYILFYQLHYETESHHYILLISTVHMVLPFRDQINIILPTTF